LQFFSFYAAEIVIRIREVCWFFVFNAGREVVKSRQVKLKDQMPKAIDLRLHGISFEDAMKRLENTPPPPTSKKSKQKAISSRRRKK